jgi:glycosyltransferase involved in cell wall biosynthesis
MKIGILTPSIYMYQKKFGGRIFAPGDLARGLVRGLVARGHEVTWFSAPEESYGATLISGNLDLLEKDHQIRFMQDIAAETKGEVSLFAMKMYYESDSTERAYTYTKENHLDVMHHFHSFGYLAHFYEEMTGMPTLYTLHDPVPTDDMLEGWLFERFPTHKFISISDNQRGNLGEHFFTTVYNGIDMSKFPFSDHGGDSFVTVGRMAAIKGHDVAIDAVKQAGAKLQIASWVSDGVKKSAFYKEKIEPQIDGINIVVNSLMQGQSLGDFYGNAKALLFPIAWAEPFGLVMVEAMSCGTPVIAYNRGSVSEIVVDGVTGFIVDPDETITGNWIIKKKGVEGLVEAMSRIGEIDRHACRRIVEERFSTEKMVENYEKAYQRIIDERK